MLTCTERKVTQWFYSFVYNKFHPTERISLGRTMLISVECMPKPNDRVLSLKEIAQLKIMLISAKFIAI